MRSVFSQGPAHRRPAGRRAGARAAYACVFASAEADNPAAAAHSSSLPDFCSIGSALCRCAAVPAQIGADAVDSAFGSAVNANRHFGASGAAQRDKADRRLGRHRLRLPKRNERRFASAPASASAAQMRKASKTIKVQNRKPVSFIRLHDHSFCAAKAFFVMRLCGLLRFHTAFAEHRAWRSFAKSASLLGGKKAAAKATAIGTYERPKRSFRPIFPLCAVFCAKKENHFREKRNRRGYAAARMASTALPHTKNCRSEYRSGNSVFFF